MTPAAVAITCALAVTNVHGKIIVCIHPDGSVTYPGDLNAASKAFWDRVAKDMPDDLKNCQPSEAYWKDAYWKAIERQRYKNISPTPEREWDLRPVK